MSLRFTHRCFMLGADGNATLTRAPKNRKRKLVRRNGNLSTDTTLMLGGAMGCPFAKPTILYWWKKTDIHQCLMAASVEEGDL